jgi:hypothetical protein
MGLTELEKEQDWLLRLLPRRYLRLNHAHLKVPFHLLTQQVKGNL